MWEEWKLVVDHAAVVSKAVVQPMEEDKEEEEDKEVDVEEGSSTEDLVPLQAPAMWATMPVAPTFWVVGLSDEVARRELATSLRAWGKVLAIQAESTPPAKTDKELVHQL